MNESRYYHDRATWKKYWQSTRSHWRMMKRYGRWDGKAQYLDTFDKKPDWEIQIIGKSGKVLRTIKRGNITFEETRRFIRMDVAAFWVTVKENLTVGQSATLIHGRIKRTFRKTA